MSFIPRCATTIMLPPSSAVAQFTIYNVLERLTGLPKANRATLYPTTRFLGLTLLRENAYERGEK